MLNEHKINAASMLELKVMLFMWLLLLLMTIESVL